MARQVVGSQEAEIRVVAKGAIEAFSAAASPRQGFIEPDQVE